MAKNVLIGLFEVESEAFQAMTELRSNPGTDKSYLSQAILVKKENGTLNALDSFDTGSETLNDTAKGGIIGALIGILGGPIGVLLGGSLGALIGSSVDTDEALENASVLEQVAGKMDDGDVAIIGIAIEENEAVLDQKLQQYKTIIIRCDAEVVEAEVAKAEEIEKEMAKDARKALREEKKAARKEKWDDKKAEYSAKKEARKIEKEAKKAEKE
jgi:hypothetical protein